MPGMMNGMSSKFLLSAALVIVGSFSQLEPARAIPQMMQKMISNKFNSADKNADGELTKAEGKAGGIPNKILEKFDLIDTDKSQSISLKEMITAFDSEVVKP
jgi:Ca2+-binding EF-hand superfamily protein